MRILIFFLILITTACSLSDTSSNATTLKAEISTSAPKWALAIHGGAGTILKKNMTDEKEAAITKALNEALAKGEERLKSGGTALDAVQDVIVFLENSPYFNAGKGAVFTNAGTNELDASIMEGKTQNAGAVGGVSNIKNPIIAARAVMEKTDHVLLTQNGAELFAKEQGLELVDPTYFYTEDRFKSLERVKAREKRSGTIDSPSEIPSDIRSLIPSEEAPYSDYKFGTVGCVALDQSGNLAAGTSTGGMTNKRYNRIGDSPIIGAGTYANNSTCAISCTGHGEFFIRYAVAHDVSAMMEYKQVSLNEAASEIVMNKLKAKGGSGGLIGIDREGNIAMPFNTAGMYRGYAKEGERKVLIYK